MNDIHSIRDQLGFTQSQLAEYLGIPRSSVNLVAEVRPYNLKELCHLYKMSYKAMYSCLKPLEELPGEKTGYYYNVKQVEIISSNLGIPYTIKENY